MKTRFASLSLISCFILALTVTTASAQVFVGGVNSDGSVLVINSTLADDFFETWSETTTGSYSVGTVVDFPQGGSTTGLAATTLAFDSFSNLLSATVDIFVDAGVDPAGTDSEAQAMVVNELFFTTTEDLVYTITGNHDFVGANASYEIRNEITGDTFSIGDFGTLDAGSYALRTTHSASSITLNGMTTGLQSVDLDINLQLTTIPEPTAGAVILLVGLCMASRRKRR